MPELAVRFTVVLAVTAVAVAVKNAFVLPAGTVTPAGTVRALLLLDRFTLSPPAGAAAVSVTVQLSVPAPAIVELLQNRPLSTPDAASPVPLSATTAVPPVGAFDVTVSEPVAAPEFVGLKFTCSVNAFPGFNVSGKAGPSAEKPAPLAVAALTVSGAVPVDSTVTNCGVACALTVTSPKARLLALRLIAAVPLGAALPDPLSATTAVPPVGASEATVSEPVAAPEFVGSKFTWRVTAFPGFSVSGKPGPATEKPAPLTVAAVTVSGAVPVERTVTNCGVACTFSVTPPKARLLALRLIAAVPLPPPPVCTGSSCRLNVAELLPIVAVMVAVCAELTAAAVSVKLALLALAATAALAGTTAAALLLDRLIVSPLLSTAPLSVIAQLSVPAPVIVLLLHATRVTVGAAGGVTAVVPVPLRATVTFPEAALLTTVSVPVAAPCAVGLN